ncbi:MAG: hypothetical protein HY782_19940 [Chloroflexi bacterium]|nr:hypothetical protein [Chloroflexota bacterium]
MKTESTSITRKPSPDTLAAALARLDVPFVMSNARGSGAYFANHPTTLLASLVAQADARLRLSIIPLLLRHPQFAALVPRAVRKVSPRRRKILKIYYTAAMLLQSKYAAPLGRLFGYSSPLPDLYSRELGIPQEGDAEMRLQALARKHSVTSALALNWIGTYEHAAKRFLKHAQKECEWAQFN